MRRLVVAAGAAVLLAGGVAGAFAYQRWQQSDDVRGSSAVEFVTSEPRRQHRPDDPIRWETYGFDPQRRRYDEGIGLRPPFRAVWTFRARDLIEFPPVLGYGRLYFQTNTGVVFALDARRGRVVWRREVGRCSAASPALARRTVFVVFLNRPPCNATGDELDGAVLALDARTGRERWRFALGPSETSPLVVDDRVYVGDWRGRVYALAARTGRVLWTSQTGAEIKGALAYADGKVFAGSYDHHVYALDARSGLRVWRAAAQQRLGPRGTFYSTPAVSYGRVYVGSTDGKVYSFGAGTGKLRWSQGTGDYVYGSPAVWRRTVYVGSHDERFYALDAATGDVRWEFDAKGRISGSAVVIDGVVYFSTLEQRTYALDARTGRHLWTWNDGKYAGAIAGRKRLFLVGHTRIYALIPRGRPRSRENG